MAMGCPRDFVNQAQQRLAWSSLEPKVLGLVPEKVEIEFRDETFEIRTDPN